jgi:hypothetical protein
MEPIKILRFPPKRQISQKIWLLRKCVGSVEILWDFEGMLNAERMDMDMDTTFFSSYMIFRMEGLPFAEAGN